MKIIIIGSVAAGTSVAAKARRNDENAEITLYNADYDISYSICGIPYFLGGEVDELETLTPLEVLHGLRNVTTWIFTPVMKLSR